MGRRTFSSSSSSALCFIVFVVTASSLVLEAAARIRHYRWDVKYELKSPDCYRKLTMTINGESPGPTIKAEEGDTVVVDVTNNLGTENLAIHWHGITQRGTPWADGTEGVTQCPTLPGETMSYKFVLDQAGTFLYHMHYGMLRQEGAQGMIEVASKKPEPFKYDNGTISILLEDWYHKGYVEQAVGLASSPFQWVGEPQSLLINGRGWFNCSGACSDAVCNNSSPECWPYSITVVPGKIYRLRIGSLTGLSSLNFEIEGHEMTVVEADSHYVEPFVVKNLFIYSGETYSVLVNASQDPTRSYWMSSAVVARNRTTPNGLGIFRYDSNNPMQKPPTPPPVGVRWDDNAPRLNQSLAIKAHKDFIQPPPQKSNREIVMLNTQNNVNGIRKWAINNVSLFLPPTPYLVALQNGSLHGFDRTEPPDTYDVNNYDIYSPPKNPNATLSDSYYRLEFNSTVDIILQNANTLTPNNSELHPWHLHGHDFWVLGYGPGKYNNSTDRAKFNLVNPIMKNTVPLHPYGWTALRFKADNPGVWLFHCHLDAHFFMGMGVVFEEGIEKVGKLPASIMGCGDTKYHRRP
ncbi:unnamed protein product [Cuscuta epithymum]|uniref:L-ascorbate oxidase n=1 Tax=Cuscuta epithymum TaxID=186058 RepID=A0AAV0GH98_9ASTE|nr:unnamed protein product [Cuscuta epithymum]